MIILDTNVISELRLPNPDPNVSSWFTGQPEAELAIASYSVADIEYGIATAPRHLVAHLTKWLDAILTTQRILPLDAAAARVLGRLHAVPALRNLIASPPHARRPRFAGDLAIAATAAAHEAVLATRNVADFRLIADHCEALTGVNPWTGETFGST